MSSIYYFAAWTDSGCLLGCDHEHQTVTEAVSCISCAGSYVIAVANNVYRALNDVEDAEFQGAPRVVPKPAELQYEKSGYAVMIRLCFVDGWGWDTWMRYKTYEEAAAHARAGNKIVPFGSAEWHALCEIREPALPTPAYVPQENIPPRRETETLIEWVCRIVPSPVDPRSLTERAIRQFDKMAVPDQSEYVGLLVQGAEQVLRGEDRADLAAQVDHLFTST